MEKIDDSLQTEEKQIESIFEDYFLKTSQESTDSSLAAPLLNCNICERIAAIKSSCKKTEDAAETFREEEDIFFKNCASQNGELTSSQIKEIDAFWAPYSFAYKNNPKTQRYFSSVSGVFDPSYITPAFHRCYLKRFWGTIKAEFICDKNNFRFLFPEAKPIPVIFRRFEGVYYDNSDRIISKEEAIDTLISAAAAEKTLTLRPCRTGGVRASILKKTTGCEEIINEINKMGENDFICQEYIASHKTWKISSSVSSVTADIMTLLYNGRPEIVSSCLNINVKNCGVDTWSIGIHDDGSLEEKAIDISKREWHDLLPSGETLKGKVLHNYQNVKDAVLAMALRVPELKTITWKMTVDTEGNTVLFDLSPFDGVEECQLHGGHPYGNKERMKEILDKYLIKSFYYERSDWEWDFWEFKSTATVCKYSGTEKNMIIPERLNGKPVTAIRPRAFAGKSLQRIFIPASVKLISEGAFFGCAQDCSITTLSHQAVYKKIYRFIKAVPGCRTFAGFLKNVWIETMVKKTSGPLEYVIKRLKDIW